MQNSYVWRSFLYISALISPRPTTSSILQEIRKVDNLHKSAWDLNPSRLNNSQIASNAYLFQIYSDALRIVQNRMGASYDFFGSVWRKQDVIVRSSVASWLIYYLQNFSEQMIVMKLCLYSPQTRVTTTVENLVHESIYSIIIHIMSASHFKSLLAKSR